MTLPTIFCPQCDAVMLDAAQCPACQWRRPVVTGLVGKPIWAVALEIKLARQGTHPAAVGRFVYFPADKGQLIALDTGVAAAEDSLVWRRQLDQRYTCDSIAVWRDYLLPGLEYSGGFPTPQAELALLSAESGDDVWRYPLEGASFSTPAVLGDIAFFAVNSGWLYAVDLAARQELWRQKLEASWSWASAAPLLTPTGLLILPARHDRLIAFDVEKKEIAWTFSAAGWFPHTPVWVEGVIYTRCWDHHLYALEATSGQEIWRQPAPRDYSSDLWVAGDRLYIGVKDYRDGAASGPPAYALYTLDRQTGQRLSRYEVSGHILARPMATDTAVFFATDDRSRELDSGGTLYALNTREASLPELLWEPCVVEQRFQSDLVVVNDLIIAGTRQGAVYAVRWQSPDTTPAAPQVYVERGAWEDAAIAYAGQGEFSQAAEIYARELAQPLQAGRLYFHAGEYRRVIEVLGPATGEAERTLVIAAARALPEIQEQARLLKELGEYVSAAQIYKEAGQLDAAGDCYQQAQAWAEARAAYNQAGAWVKWDKLTRDLNLWQELVERFLAAGEYTQAAEVYAGELGLFVEAADCYDRAGLPAEALAAYRRVSQEKMTAQAHRRLAELAEAADQIDVALAAYRALGELDKAAALAAAAGQYAPALALYQELDERLKQVEMLENLARYAEAAELLTQAGHWGQAAAAWEQQVDQEIKRAGGVRYVRNSPQVEAWLARAIEGFEEEHEVAETKSARNYNRQCAERCRNKLLKLKREPLLRVSFETNRLVLGQSSVIRCTVENIGWGIARNVTLTIDSHHLQYQLDPLPLGDLSRGEPVTRAFTLVPNIPGDLELQVKLQGRAKSGQAQTGEWRILPVEGGPCIILDAQAGPASSPTPTPDLGQLWDEGSAPGSTGGDADSEVVSQSDLKQHRRESLRRQLAQHYANLNKLQEQAALFGAGQAPLNLLNQIEVEQNAIAEIEQLIAQ